MRWHIPLGRPNSRQSPRRRAGAWLPPDPSRLPAILVECLKRVLSLRIALLGRGPEQFSSTSEILRELLAFQVQQAEIVGGGGVAQLGGGCKEPRRLGAVVQTAPARHVEDRKREHGIAVTAVRREPVPLDSLGIIQPHPKAVGIKFSEQRHGAHITFLIDTPRGLRKGREKIAA